MHAFHDRSVPHDTFAIEATAGQKERRAAVVVLAPAELLEGEDDSDNTTRVLGKGEASTCAENYADPHARRALPYGQLTPPYLRSTKYVPRERPDGNQIFVAPAPIRWAIRGGGEHRGRASWTHSKRLLVAIPFALTGVAVVAAGGVIWGAAKVVEGVGKGLAAGSEAAARAAMGSVEAPESRESGEARTSETASERKKKGVRRKGKGKSEK